MLYVQGTLIDKSSAADIDTRPIVSGVVSPSASGPMWGGLAITASLQRPLGFSLQLAQSAAQITGFTVFDQSTALFRSKQDPVPSAGPSMGINFVNVGSGAQLVLQADPALLSALNGANASTPLSWDFNLQRVTAYSGAAGRLPCKSIVGAVDAAYVVACDGDRVRWKAGEAAVVLEL
jgi:hypothetical protein